jgi:hypothetical protein
MVRYASKYFEVVLLSFKLEVVINKEEKGEQIQVKLTSKLGLAS